MPNEQAAADPAKLPVSEIKVQGMASAVWQKEMLTWMADIPKFDLSSYISNYKGKRHSSLSRPGLGADHEVQVEPFFAAFISSRRARPHSRRRPPDWPCRRQRGAVMCATTMRPWPC